MTSDCVPSHIASWTEAKQALFSAYIEEQKNVTQQTSIKEGDTVIVDCGRGRSFVKVSSGSKFKVVKTRLDAKLLVGQSFGPTLSLDKLGSQPSFKRKRVEKGPEYDASFTPCSNNSELFDDSTSQALSTKDIEGLKKENNADELIALIAKGSTTFANKTEFSQEKYLKRKKNKYAADIVLRRPTIEAMCNLFLEKAPKKILSIRPDTIAYMLTSANIHAGCTSLVVDSCAGLLLAAVAEKQGGFGRIFNFHEGRYPLMDCCVKMGFDTGITGIIMQCPVNLLKPVQQALADQSSPSSVVSCSSTAISASTETNSGGVSVSHEIEKPLIEIVGLSGRTKHYSKKVISTSEALSQSNGTVDSVIVASKFHPMDIIPVIFPLLRSAGQLVVFSETIEPLVSLMDSLKKEDKVCMPELGELWTRDHQVLSNRTHPLMMMNATGGYMFTATKVL
jgi:tRNA (adenine-N(1)-)-methyltransferase non-catalytic subunit